MKYSNRRRIAALLCLALVISVASKEVKDPFLIPEETTIEGPQLSLEKNGKRKRLAIK